MPPFSEVTRIDAAIRNRSAKEMEWSLWYCRMRQATPSARPADVKYWGAVEEKVLSAMAPPVEAKAYPARKKRASGRGLGRVWSRGPRSRREGGVGGGRAPGAD